MRVKCPPSFSAMAIGPEGQYHLHFEPLDEWDGVTTTEIAGTPMRWKVDVIESDESGNIAFSGLTRGSEPVWHDCFWFELRLDANSIIAYWGNQVLLRTDPVTASPKVRFTHLRNSH